MLPADLADEVEIDSLMPRRVGLEIGQSEREEARGSGIYNAGSGVPRSFNDIVANLNRVLNTQWQPEYIDNPHAHYQPHTEADLTQTTRALRYTPKFTLEKGIDDYAASGFLV